MLELEEYKVVISKRATQGLVSHAAFVARLDEGLAVKLGRFPRNSGFSKQDARLNAYVVLKCISQRNVSEVDL